MEIISVHRCSNGYRGKGNGGRGVTFVDNGGLHQIAYLRSADFALRRHTQMRTEIGQRPLKHEMTQLL